MRAQQIIFQVLTEARVFKDLRTQKGQTEYMVAPAVYSDPETVSRDQGYIVLIDAPTNDDNYSKLRRQFDDNHRSVDKNRKFDSYGSQKEWWSNWSMQSWKGLIVSHSAKTVNVDLEHLLQHRHRRPDPKSDKHSWTIPLPGGSDGSPLSNLYTIKMLKLVVQLDPAVANFKVVGSPTFSGTVAELINTPDRAQTILQKTSGELTFYHGTSLARYQVIRRDGLRPGNTNGGSDVVPGYSDNNIYLAPDVETARNYATRAAVYDKGTAVVLKVTVRDFTKFVPDEDALHWIRNSKFGRKYYDQMAKGIPDLHNDKTGEPYSDTHFRHWNWTKASPELKKLLQLWQADGSTYRGSIAYRGSIRPSDIKVVETYKPQKMRRDPSDEEFKQSMDATRSTLKTYDDQNPFTK